jgi:hypothetical protein
MIGFVHALWSGDRLAARSCVSDWPAAEARVFRFFSAVAQATRLAAPQTSRVRGRPPSLGYAVPAAPMSTGLSANGGHRTAAARRGPLPALVLSVH